MTMAMESVTVALGTFMARLRDLLDSPKRHPFKMQRIGLNSLELLGLSPAGRVG